MIDTTKFYFHMTQTVRHRLNELRAPRQYTKRLYGNRFYLQHPFRLRNPAVRFNITTRELCIETSLPKLFQGHNVGGINRVEFLCLHAIALIYEQLGLCFSARERQLIQRHGIRLGRLDTTCCFSMPSPRATADALECVLQQLRTEGFSWSAYGESRLQTVYSQQNSTRVSDKFYDKGSEFVSKRVRTNMVAFSHVWEYARTQLRFEVTWRAKEMKALDLEYADQWTPQLVRQMVLSRLRQFKFCNETVVEIAPKALDSVNSSCRTHYDLWSRGADLRAHRYNRTVDRARTYLLQRHHVDIYRPPASPNTMPLRELLAEENAYFVAPKWLTRRGAIFAAPARDD